MGLKTRFIRSVVSCIAPLLLTGCIPFYSYQPVQVTVQDAETSAPIGGAEVGVSYHYMLTLNPPRPDKALTDQNGHATLRGATFNLRVFSASANGYLSEPWYKAVQRSRGKLVSFSLYRQPEPTIMVIVPNHYRGPLKLDLRPGPGMIQEQAGKREFTFKATPAGYVAIDAAPLLFRVSAIDVKAMYDDGTRIPQQDWRVKPDDIALRWITGARSEAGNARDLFVIGTEKDENALHPIIYNYINGDPHHISLNHDRFNELFDRDKE